MAGSKLWGAVQKEQSALWTAKKSSGKGVTPPDCQAWRNYDGAQDTSGAKPAKAQAAAVRSETLWEASSIHGEEEAADKPAPQLTRKNSKGKAKKASKTVLWAPPPTPTRTESKGMFKLRPKQPDRRTTTAEPAAVNMARKPRAPDHSQPLEKLTSKAMWTPDAVAVLEYNWITGKQKQPPSPTRVASLLIPANGTGSKQPTWWEKMKFSFGMPPKAPAAAAAAVPPTAADGAAPPLRQQYRATAVVHGDWDAALRAAVKASYPQPRMPRPQTTTVAMWHAALAEAVSRSQTYDAAKTHPVFAASPSSMVASSEWFHPAATGYTYDQARVTPVFFGSLAIMCDVDQVHPAMADFVAAAQNQPLSRQNSRSGRSQRGGNPLSRSDSNRSKRKDQVKAQIRAMMESPEPDQTSSNAAPATQEAVVGGDDLGAAMSRRDQILAQIEALEREKEFAMAAVRQSMMEAPAEAAAATPAAANAPPAPQGYAASHSSAGKALWSKPADIDTTAAQKQRQQPTRDGPMWTGKTPKTPKTPRSSGIPAHIARPVDRDSEIVRVRSRREQRRAEIMTQIAVLESNSARVTARAGELLSSDNDQQQRTLWRGSSGNSDKNKDWLKESSKKGSSSSAGGGVQLRY